MNRLPNPDALRDAMFLVDHPGWNPRDLDDADALVLSLMKLLNSPVTKG